MKKCCSDQLIAFLLIIIFYFPVVFHFQLSEAPAMLPHPSFCWGIWACAPHRTAQHRLGTALLPQLGNKNKRRKRCSTNIQRKQQLFCARALVFAYVKLTLSQILCEDKWAPALRRTEKKWLHVVLKHTQSYASTESQRSCQRGGSLFIYCLYTEKKETASIM